MRGISYQQQENIINNFGVDVNVFFSSGFVSKRSNYPNENIMIFNTSSAEFLLSFILFCHFISLILRYDLTVNSRGISSKKRWKDETRSYINLLYRLGMVLWLVSRQFTISFSLTLTTIFKITFGKYTTICQWGIASW